MFDKQFFRGVAFIAILMFVCAGAVALYKGSFRSTVSVTVEADRAGLTMDVGSPVKVRGVEVGKVTAINASGKIVLIEAAIDAGKIHDISAEVTAQVVPPTAFGSKYIQLTPPANATGAHLRSGDTITAEHVTVEINEAFTNLTKVLHAARPSEVNNALTAVATAVDGRGDQLGTLITQVDRYLTAFNPQLQTLSDDIRRADDVVSTYRDALPDLLKIADQASVTGDTVTRQRTSLQAFLVNLNSAAHSSDGLLKATESDLTASLNLLDPVTAVLAEYSSELPCLVPGIVRVNQLGERAVGGGEFPGVTTFTGFQHQDAPYRSPENLPKVADKSGPSCYGLPVVSEAEAQVPNPVFETGANPYSGDSESPANNAMETFFGVLAGMVNFG